VTTDNKNTRWKTLLDREFEKITTDIMLIGHSPGGAMLLKYLSEEKTEMDYLNQLTTYCYDDAH